MIDERAIPPAGRIGETEDLIGSVFVKDGKVCSLVTITCLEDVIRVEKRTAGEEARVLMRGEELTIGGCRDL